MTAVVRWLAPELSLAAADPGTEVGRVRRQEDAVPDLDRSELDGLMDPAPGGELARHGRSASANRAGPTSSAMWVSTSSSRFTAVAESAVAPNAMSFSAS